jgi:hypothetical protein
MSIGQPKPQELFVYLKSLAGMVNSIFIVHYDKPSRPQRGAGVSSPVYESISVKTATQFGLNSVYQPSTSKRQNNRLPGRCIQDLREEASRSFSIERNTSYQSFPTLISLAKASKLFLNSSHKATESMKRRFVQQKLRRRSPRRRFDPQPLRAVRCR